jgi:hypothetical protein
VTITVPIDCVGCKDWIDPINGGDLAKYWKKTAEKMRQKEFDKYSYCNKYKFKLDIKMTNRSAGSAGRFGSHELIATQPDGRGFSGAGWGGAPESTPGGPEGQRASDGTRYYEFDAQGTMPADATPTVIAHKFGHVIGLGDDRDADGNPIGPDPVNTGVCAIGRTEADFTLEGNKTRADQLPGHRRLPDPCRPSDQRRSRVRVQHCEPGGDVVYFVTLNFTAKCQNCSGRVS